MPKFRTMKTTVPLVAKSALVAGSNPYTDRCLVDTGDNNPDTRQVSLYTIADRENAAAIEQEAQKIFEERTAKQKVFMAEALYKKFVKCEEPLRAELRTDYEKPEKERSNEQASLLKKYPSVNITPGVLYEYLLRQQSWRRGSRATS